jgi:hypothetical protein
LPVSLTDESPMVHQVDLDEALSRNELARAVLTTESLDEVEAYSREICGYSEIDYERNKAAWLKDQAEAELDADSVLSQVDEFEAEARGRGITHTTFRHLTEVLSLNGSHRDSLRQLLVDRFPQQYAAPLWRFR